MGATLCPDRDCGGTHFIAEKYEPKDLRYAIALICCSKCGKVVGVSDQPALRVIIDDLEMIKRNTRK